VRLPHPVRGKKEMKTIKLTRDKWAIVDDEDYESLNQYKWHAICVGGIYYAARKAKVDGRWTSILMHRQITGAKKGESVDHIDHNGLNNRKSCNLRICTHQQNLFNQRPQKNRTSDLRGVNLYKPTNKYRARARLNDKDYHLGYFENEKEAGLAYDAFAKEHFGEFAYLNFGGEGVRE